MEDAIRLLGLAQHHLGAGLTGFEMMGQFALSLVARHFPAQHMPLPQTATFYVLLENVNHESDAHARAQLEHYKSPVALAMMRSITRALDLQNLMKPGRVIRM
jgi:hypothetical protein